MMDETKLWNFTYDNKNCHTLQKNKLRRLEIDFKEIET